MLFFFAAILQIISSNAIQGLSIYLYQINSLENLFEMTLIVLKALDH